MTLVPTPRRYVVAKSFSMTDPTNSSEPPAATAQRSVADPSHPPNRLDKIWSVVAITAGAVFIVTVIFFWGFFLGRTTNGPAAQHVSNGSGGDSCPMMGSGGGTRPGTMSPGSMEPNPPATPAPQPTPHP